MGVYYQFSVLLFMILSHFVSAQLVFKRFCVLMTIVLTTLYSTCNNCYFFCVLGSRVKGQFLIVL